MDCMVAMRQMKDREFDLAIVDPPYGINITKSGTRILCSQSVNVERERERTAVGGANAFGGKKNQDRGRSVIKPKIYHSFDDKTPPDAEYFSELKRVSKNQIIWGGNYFLDYLGSTPCMICWDKCRTDLNFADGEFAWTSFESPARVFRFKWNGMLQQDMKNKEERIHPTQKPVRLYQWLLEHFAKEGDRILDTHLGSGSSRIAAYELGFDFVGYEIDEVFYQEQEERFKNHTAQQNLFLMDGDT